MVRKHYTILVALLMPLTVFAQDLSSWRTPTQRELGHDLGWRKGDPNRYHLIKADFDGDGKQDTARLVLNDKENKMGILVTLSTLGNARPFLIETNNDKNAIEARGITVAKPGKYETACGKGVCECKEGEPERIQLDHPAIDFFKYGSANMYFVWDVGRKSFNKIYIND